MAERAVRPLAIGRKNWMFFGSPEGGAAGAILYSLVQTCRGLDINLREYLEDVFGKLQDHNSQKLHELLPDQWLLHRKLLSNLDLSATWACFPVTFTAKTNSERTDGSVPSLKYERNYAFAWQRWVSWILLFGVIGHVVQMRFVELS